MCSIHCAYLTAMLYVQPVTQQSKSKSTSVPKVAQGSETRKNSVKDLKSFQDCEIVNAIQ